MRSRPLLDPARNVIGQDNFAAVLTMLLAAYIVSALAPGGARSLVIGLYAAALFLAMVMCRPRGRTVRLILAICVGTTAVCVVGFAALPVATAEGLLDASVALVLIITLSLMLNRIMRVHAISAQTLAGALSAYLLIAMFFTAVYGVVDAFDPEPFFASGEVADSRSIQYFSFTTLTTLGYGDLTAAGDTGRALASLEAMLGQIFLATLVARLVAQMARQETREG